MIAIIDYEAGNIASVKNALARFGIEFVLTNDIDTLNAADGIIFPGQGHFGAAMKALKKTGLDTWLIETEKPILGICVGMQLMYEGSEESDVPGLGILKGTLKRFDNKTVKVPHMGWNTMHIKKPHTVIDNFCASSYFYYVHSFYAPVTEHTIASCTYETEFTAVAAHKNYVGVQFHPEKSGREGAMLIQNFIHQLNAKATGS